MSSLENNGNRYNLMVFEWQHTDIIRNNAQTNWVEKCHLRSIEIVRTKNSMLFISGTEWFTRNSLLTKRNWTSGHPFVAKWRHSLWCNPELPGITAVVKNSSVALFVNIGCSTVHLVTWRIWCPWFNRASHRHLDLSHRSIWSQTTMQFILPYSIYRCVKPWLVKADLAIAQLASTTSNPWPSLLINIIQKTFALIPWCETYQVILPKRFLQPLWFVITLALSTLENSFFMHSCVSYKLHKIIIRFTVVRNLQFLAIACISKSPLQHAISIWLEDAPPFLNSFHAYANM